jgi:hypothetical protein
LECVSCAILLANSETVRQVGKPLSGQKFFALGR